MVDTFIVLRVVIRRISSSRSERRQRLLVLRLAGQVPCSFGWCRQGTRGATLSLAALAFAVLAACGGDAKGPVSGPAVQTSSAPTLAASDALPSVPGYARPPATGIADLDVIVAVLSNRSLATTSYLLDLQYLECRSFQTGVLVPACPRGVAPGTTVPMLPLEACAEGYANADTLDAYLRGTTPEGLAYTRCSRSPRPRTQAGNRNSALWSLHLEDWCQVAMSCPWSTARSRRSHSLALRRHQPNW